MSCTKNIVKCRREEKTDECVSLILSCCVWTWESISLSLLSCVPVEELPWPPSTASSGLDEESDISDWSMWKTKWERLAQQLLSTLES